MEKEIIDRARNGDAEAISFLYQKHKDAVYKFIYYKVGSVSDAEDLFQEIMIAAFESLNRFRGEVPFLHWCYQISRNKISYFWRERLKVKITDLDEESMGYEMDFAENEEDLEAALTQSLEAQKQQLSLILNQMPERYAELLKLRFLENKTLAQIAETMEISVNNTKVLQYRALKKAAELVSNTPSL